MKFVKFSLISLISILTLSSCFGKGPSEIEKLQASLDRSSETVISMDESESQSFSKRFTSRLPKAIENNFWPRSGYIPSENLAVKSFKNDYESSSIGEDPKDGLRITTTPVAADGVIYTLGGQGEVQAREVGNPNRVIWEQIVDLENEAKDKHGFYRRLTGMFYDSENFLGGNICYSSNTVFVTTKRGNIYAFEAKSGKLRWTRKLDVTIRSAPVAASGKLIITTSENKTYALSTADGKSIWIHEGLSERSKLASSPAPFIHNGKVILTYSSGEVYQLSLDRGKEVWSTITSPTLITVLNPSINDIGFSPVHHKGRVFIVTSDGRIVALDYATGNTLYEVEGLSVTSPIWPAADSVFAVNRFGELISVSITDGKIAFRKPMEDLEEVNDEKIIFSGPIVLNGQIFVANNDGDLKVFSAETGEEISEYDIPEDIYLNPMTINGRLFLLASRNSKLIYFN